MDSSESDDDLNFINNIATRKPREFRLRKDYLEILDDENFHKRFRLTKSTFRFVLEKIRAKISSRTRR